MLSCYSIILDIENKKREILVSPFLLQSKEHPNIKSGTIYKLFLYENWIDEDYKANLGQEYLTDNFKTDDLIINYGQDFGKYYLGCLDIDFDNKLYREWQGQSDKINEKDIKIFVKTLFSPDVKSRRLTIFTPTRPSDLNLKCVKMR